MSYLALLRVAELSWAGGRMSHPFQVNSSCLRRSNKSYPRQDLSNSYMCEHTYTFKWLLLLPIVGGIQKWKLISKQEGRIKIIFLQNCTKISHFFYCGVVKFIPRIVFQKFYLVASQNSVKTLFSFSASYFSLWNELNSGQK